MGPWLPGFPIWPGAEELRRWRPWARRGRNRVLLVPVPGGAGMTPGWPRSSLARRSPESPREAPGRAGVRAPKQQHTSGATGSTDTADGATGDGPARMVLRVEGSGEPGLDGGRLVGPGRGGGRRAAPRLPHSRAPVRACLSGDSGVGRSTVGAARPLHATGGFALCWARWERGTCCCSCSWLPQAPATLEPGMDGQILLMPRLPSCCCRCAGASGSAVSRGSCGAPRAPWSPWAPRAGALCCRGAGASTGIPTVPLCPSSLLE